MFSSIPPLGVMDIVDILVVAFLIYKLMLIIRSTSAARVARSIMLLLVATWLTDVVHMYTLNWILTRFIEVGIIAIVIVFQPELRRALERFGGRTMLRFADPLSNRSVEQNAIAATVTACEIMAKERVGVLLVFERRTSLEEYFKTGTLIDAKVTDQLLRNLFSRTPRSTTARSSSGMAESRRPAACCRCLRIRICPATLARAIARASV